MFIKNPPKGLKGGEQAAYPEVVVAEALRRAGLPFNRPASCDVRRKVDFELPTIGIELEVRSDWKRAKPGDLVVEGEQGFSDLIDMFAKLAKAAA
jgi:hypothetical protein